MPVPTGPSFALAGKEVSYIAMRQAVDIIRAIGVVTRMGNAIDATDAKATVYTIAVKGMQADLEKQIKLMIANWPRAEIEQILKDRDSILANPHMYV